MCEEPDWLRELAGVYWFDVLETLELWFGYGLLGMKSNAPKLGLLAGKYASGIADTLEFLDDEESSDVWNSVLDESEISLVSPRGGNKWTSCCWYGVRLVAYGEGTVPKLLKKSCFVRLAAGRGCIRTRS